MPPQSSAITDPSPSSFSSPDTGAGTDVLAELERVRSNLAALAEVLVSLRARFNAHTHSAAVPAPPAAESTLDPPLALFAADAFGPETDLADAATSSLGQLLQQTLADLATAQHPSRRLALRQQAAVIALGLARVGRLGARSGEDAARLGAVLDEMGPKVFPATHGVTPPAERPRSGGAPHAKRSRHPRRQPPKSTPPSADVRDEVDCSPACYPSAGAAE